MTSVTERQVKLLDIMYLKAFLDMRFGDFKITQKAKSTYDDLDSSVYLRLAFLGSISSPGTKTEKTSALRDSPAPDCSAERTAASGPRESVHRSTSVQAL